MQFCSAFSKILFVTACVASQACSSVAPWERGLLAREEMAIDPNPKLSHLRDHIFTSREASQGGAGSSGGGCGCN